MTVWGTPYNDLFYELTRETEDIDFRKDESNTAEDLNKNVSGRKE